MKMQTLYTGRRICYHGIMRGFQLLTIALTFIVGTSAQLSTNLECKCRLVGGDRYTCDCAAVRQATSNASAVAGVSSASGAADAVMKVD
jgi:hypothetical protein